MRKAMRQEKILERLRQDGALQLSDLTQALNVSAVTIRSDLNELSQKGHLTRTHGGAVLRQDEAQGGSLGKSLFRPLVISNQAYKEALAEEVVKHIAPNDSIFLSSGTTFYVIARHLKHMRDLRIVTSNISIAYELAPYNPNVFFIGGEMCERDGIYYTGGPKVPLELEKIFVNKAFIGVNGIDMNAYATMYDLSQFSLLMTAKKMASKVILVCDASKIGVQSGHRLGSVLDIADEILTNREVDPRFLFKLREMNIPIITT